ncbi:MAG: carbohydrate ABC transporter permease [Spirochaetaceae bacterium]|jgi:raffinose/stachyose/melibiose transport system permease protein|nr:carbohydrate ABC transporter permease [Spirochaetaceae bacterium]
MADTFNKQTESIHRQKFTPGWVLAVIFAIFWLFVAGLPLYYMLLSSFKTQGEFIQEGLFSLPKHFGFANYATVLSGNIWNYFKNSVLVLVISLSLLLFISACAAYPLSRMRFRLNRPIYGAIVAAMSIPIHITLIPVFQMSIQTGIYDSIWALIGPNIAFNLPISVFILTSFMQGIPTEIEEAAELDGCGKGRIFFSHMLPLSVPGISTIGIYNSVIIWNEFSFAMVLTQTQKARTLPLAVWEYQGQYTINIPLIMTLLIIASLPVILLYCFGQDKLVKGMMAGAVKG